MRSDAACTKHRVCICRHQHKWMKLYKREESQYEKIGFDNEKYLKMQSEHIRERIGKFDNKLYLEFGGKLFDDYHASRVLPGFEPDSKLRMLMQLSDQAESSSSSVPLISRKIKCAATLALLMMRMSFVL